MKSIIVVGVLLLAAVPLSAQESLPAPWQHQDIGPLQTPGTAEHAAGAFAVQGTMDIWGTADGCHIAWQPAHGDVELAARVTAIENPGGVAHAKASLCIRESLDAGSRHVALCVTAADGTQFLCRDKTNGKTVRVLADAAAQKTGVPKGQFPCWLKIVRHGDEFSAYESVDGETWQLSGRIKLDLAADTVVGLAASSHKPDILAKATFDHVTLANRPTSPAAEIYVSVDGRDSNPGTLQEPFATIARARDEVRKRVAAGLNADVTVFIRGGSYTLAETLVFGLEDSASAGHTITYAAYRDERPVISSGVAISGWKKLADPPAELPAAAQGEVWVADVPASLGRFYSLYDHEGPLPRAQSEGFMIEAPPGETAGGRSRSPDARRNLYFPAGKVKNWPNLDDVEMVLRPSIVWTMNILALESVDEAARMARTQLPASYPLRPLANKSQPSAWVENVLEALGKPGQWVLNTHTKKLYLWPRDGKPEGIVAPKLRELTRVEGKIDVKGPTDIPVRGLGFKGLTFAHADRDLWLQGDRGIQHDWEMEDKPDALVRLRGAENCVIENCKFKDSGGNAIRLDLFAQGNRIAGNEIRNLGQGGIILIGYGPGTKDVNKGNQILNNHIHHCGLLYWHSHAIVLWQSGENRVAHNYIHDMPRKALCLSGARFNYFQRGPSDSREVASTLRWFEIGQPLKSTSEYAQALRFLHTRNNVVEDNEVTHVLQKLGDGAAMNITGAGRGNVFRHNYLHDIFATATAVLRNDDWQAGSLWEDNVVIRSNLHFAENKGPNDVINNVVIDVRPSGYFKTMVVEPPLDGARFERNIFYNSKGTATFFVFGTYVPSPTKLTFDLLKPVKIDHNVFYDAGSSTESSPGFMQEMHARGLGEGDIYADPQFVDVEHGDYRLKPDSPALKLGIKSIDVSNCGLSKEFPSWLLE